jgi:hypothetical protein
MSEPMFWLPPVRFSTTTGWVQTPDSAWGDGARDGVRRAAGCERHDDPDGTFRKPLRRSKCREQCGQPGQQPSLHLSSMLDFALPVYLFGVAAYDGLSQEETPC